MLKVKKTVCRTVKTKVRQSFVESRYVVPPFSVKVSESRTGQDASILKLAPGLKSKGESQLIGG